MGGEDIGGRGHTHPPFPLYPRSGVLHLGIGHGVAALLNLIPAFFYLLVYFTLGLCVCVNFAFVHHTKEGHVFLCHGGEKQHSGNTF